MRTVDNIHILFANILLQELQGTLLVTLRNSATNQPIDDEEVRRKFQQFGDVKSVRPAGDRPEYVLRVHLFELALKRSLLQSALCRVL